MKGDGASAAVIYLTTLAGVALFIVIFASRH